jgi:hypothetical protein
MLKVAGFSDDADVPAAGAFTTENSLADESSRTLSEDGSGRGPELR